MKTNRPLTSGLAFALVAALSMQLAQGAALGQDPPWGAPAQVMAPLLPLVGATSTSQRWPPNGNSLAGGEIGLRFRLGDAAIGHTWPGSDNALGNQVTAELVPLCEIREPAWGIGSKAKAAISDNELFIPLGAQGLAIYDISNPREPQLVARVSTETLHGQGGAVEALSGRAFVALPVSHTMAVLDLTNPSAPKFIGTFGDIPQIVAMELRGDNLYVYAGSDAANLGGVYVYDVRSRIPTLRGSYLADQIDPGFFVTGNRVVFLSSHPGRIEVVDMSDPAAPSLIGEWTSPHPGNITEIDLVGRYLFASAYWGGLWILDATDYGNLQWITGYDWPDPQPCAVSVQATPFCVFLAQGGVGLPVRVFEVLRFDGFDVALDDVVTATNFPADVCLDGDLLVLEEWGENEKVLRLFRAPPIYGSFLPITVKDYSPRNSSGAACRPIFAGSTAPTLDPRPQTNPAHNPLR